ncbi:MAG: hypothetical protein ACFFAN_03085 [Promethearchaeota archaeon]
MSENIPKEVIGIAHASEWNHIKQFLKALLELSFDKDEFYSLIVLNALINNKKCEEYDAEIKTKAQIKLLDSINDFEKVSLYQYSEYKRNVINLSKDKNIIVLTAQYMGPEIDHTNYFNFAIYLDSFNLPYFSDNKGNIFDCHEIMKIINNFKSGVTKKVRKREPPKKSETFPIEVETYERVTEKNAMWGNPLTETKGFQKWKMRIHKQFREKTGGFPYYKGKITQKYEIFLNNLVGKPIVEKESSKKPKAKKARTKKQITKKEIIKKPVVKKRPITKKQVAKKKSIAKKSKVKRLIKEPEYSNLEVIIYKKLTGKNAIKSGNETKFFKQWKLKIHKEFQQKKGGRLYYKGNLTQKYEKYLSSL